MTSRQLVKNVGKGLAAGAAVAGAGYVALIAHNRARYGHATIPSGAAADAMIDRFIPEPEIAEHHQIAIEAAADVVLAAAKDFEMLELPLVRMIIHAREVMLGGAPDTRPHPSHLVEQMQSIGWVILDERPDREIVLGAVTKPWEATPVFRSIPAEQFAAFSEPGFVKIAWTLRADPIDAHRSVFHTETRVATTDEAARRRFRRYWSLVAPGVGLIRRAMLRPLKRAAERRGAPSAA